MAEKEMVEETKSMMLHLCRLAIEDIEAEYFTKQSIKSGFPVGVSGEQLKAMMDPQCDENGNYLGSSKCNFCITSKGQAHRGKIDKCPQEVIDNL